MKLISNYVDSINVVKLATFQNKEDGFLITLNNEANEKKVEVLFINRISLR